jgi:hypothetical protein
LFEAGECIGSLFVARSTRSASTSLGVAVGTLNMLALASRCGEDRIGAVSQLGREYLAREASPLQESQLIDTVQFSSCLLKTVIVAFMLQNGVMMLSISRIFQLHIRGV